jgi:hypothetical protein
MYMPRVHNTTLHVDALLKFFAGGVILATGLVAPNAVRLLNSKHFAPKKLTEKDTAEYKRLVRHMKRLNLINIEKLSDGKTYITLTDAGERRLKKAQIEELTIPTPKEWDGKWRIVSFDIPASMKKQRYEFLHHLHRLGFIRSLQSMWVYPFACAWEVHEIAVACGIDKYVLIITGELTEDRHIKLAQDFKPLLSKVKLTYKK